MIFPILYLVQDVPHQVSRGPGSDRSRRLTYREGSHGRANGRATQYAPEDKFQDPHVNLPEEHVSGGAHQVSAEPGWPPVQVHLEEG